MKQEGQVKIKQIAEPTAEVERDIIVKDARGCTEGSAVAAAIEKVISKIFIAL